MKSFWRNCLENKSKAETYIGFAIRKGSYKIGVNAINTIKKAQLLIICSSAGEDTQNKSKKFARKWGCKILQIKKPLKEVVFRENAKLMAITDKVLAEAILENINNEFIEVVLGE